MFIPPPLNLSLRHSFGWVFLGDWGGGGGEWGRVLFGICLLGLGDLIFLLLRWLPVTLRTVRFSPADHAIYGTICGALITGHNGPIDLLNVYKY